LDIAAELDRFIVDELAGPDQKEIGREDDLVAAGIVDSLGIMRLMTFIEEKFGVAIDPDEIVPENFRDVVSLTKFVADKQA